VTPEDASIITRVRIATDALIAALPSDADTRVLSTAVACLITHIAMATEEAGGMSAEDVIAVLSDGALEMTRLNSTMRLTARTVGEA
jgi:hypothetical protein